MKPCMLITVTKEKKFQIEVALEDYFEKLMDREVKLSAELIEGCTDKYKITVEQEGEWKHLMPISTYNRQHLLNFGNGMKLCHENHMFLITNTRTK